ncbi:MAG: glycosyl hydrolase [Bryobacteraceae bacterium]|nr:glycosyl hydrolase [Bryobacteraceae bacterium]MDW8376855.1 glycosyl hydrolase [Bryobacterales bacterium]
MKRLFCGFVLSVLWAGTSFSEDLESGWRNPPRPARPHVYWLWLNGWVDVAAAREELRAMKDAGIGGVLLFDMGARGDASQQPPAGPAFLSNDWLRNFRELVTEAKKLDLEVDFSVISSWDLGGAWTRPEHASMALAVAETSVTGGRTVELELPYPDVPRGAPKGPDGKAAHWKHVALLAVPSQNRKPGHDFIFRLLPGRTPGPLRTVILDPGDVPAGSTPVPMSQVRRFEIAVSEDGSKFRPVLRGELQRSNQPQSFPLAPDVKGGWLRLRLIDAWDPNIPHWTLGEFQVLNAHGENLAALHLPGQIRGGAKILAAPLAYSTGALWNTENIHDGDRVGGRGVFATGGLPPFDLPTQGALVLDSFVGSQDRLRWDAPPGQWTILRYVAMNTGERLKVPSPNSDGWATDHLNPEATRAHLEHVLGRLRTVFPDLRASGLRHLYLPSYEVVGHIWSPGFLADFRRLRGYDFAPYLPVVFGSTAGDGERTERVRFDYEKTLSDVLIHAYYTTAREQARKAGLAVKSEAGGPGPPVHNVPVDSLLANSQVDSVQGEFWPFRPTADALWVVKETASAAHLYGKRRVHMEAFTSFHHWYEAPQDLKESADRAFCEGMNHVVWHTWSHVPRNSPKPGWVYSAGSHLNRNVTWWPFVKPFLDYLSRVSYLLQQGVFVGDVLYYYGDGGYKFVPPRRVPADLGPGYDYDAINSDAILTRLSVRDQRLVTPDGASYAALVLPDGDAMDPEVLARLESLVQAGATILGPPPRRAPGLSGFPQADARVRELAERLWANLDGKTRTERRVGQGAVVWGKSVGQVFRERKLLPDVEAASGFDFTHRRTPQAEIYFIRNRTRSELAGELLFRVAGRRPEIWDPVTGRIEKAVPWRSEADRTAVSLRLAPLGSTFVLFRQISALPPREPTPAQRLRVSTAEQSFRIPGPWQVEFPAPLPSLEMRDLVSWTQLEKEQHRYFSGIVRYRTSFDVPASWLRAGQVSVLDLGRLWAIASVRMNGQELGVVWTEPFQVDASRALRAGKNELEIEVANTWHNRLVGDAQLPPDRRQTATNILVSDNVAWKDWPLRDSGLFGPVTLIAEPSTGTASPVQTAPSPKKRRATRVD